METRFIHLINAQTTGGFFLYPFFKLRVAPEVENINTLLIFEDINNF